MRLSFGKTKKFIIEAVALISLAIIGVAFIVFETQAVIRFLQH